MFKKPMEHTDGVDLSTFVHSFSQEMNQVLQEAKSSKKRKSESDSESLHSLETLLEEKLAQLRIEAQRTQSEVLFLELSHSLVGEERESSPGKTRTIGS
jgi:hypothetical protein